MYFFSIFFFFLSNVHLQLNGISAVYDFYFNGKRRRNEKYIIERLKHKRKRENHFCVGCFALPIFILFSSFLSWVSLVFFRRFCFGEYLCINILFSRSYSFQLLNFLNNSLFNYCRLSIYNRAATFSSLFVKTIIEVRFASVWFDACNVKVAEKIYC